MPTPLDVAREIVQREGGWSDDPADPGGATNFGVTLGTLRGLRLDLDGDGAVTTADLRRLTREQAAQVFLAHYFRAPRLDLLPPAIQASVFDMQVNAGTQAVRILQRLLRDMGFDVVVDGVVGPRTAAAAAAADAAAPGLADAYAIARRNYYYALADRRPASRRFARRRDGGKGGWITRAEAFLSPALRLTDAQHRARCAAWA